MTLNELLKVATDKGASDMFFIAGFPPAYRKDSQVTKVCEEPLSVQDVEDLVHEIYSMTNGRPIELLLSDGDDDFSFSAPGVGRFRANTFRQRGSLAAVIRVVMFDLPDPSDLDIPETVMNLGDYTKGLVLITGPAGSGKSTTLACLVDKINSQRSDHIITMEDPIEFIHRHKKSIVSQREINSDTKDYASALRAVVSQQLIPSVDGRLVPAFEIMLLTPAIRNLIRESKVHQIDSAIYAGAGMGMITMDQSILNLYKKGVITADTALQYSANLEEMKKKVQG